MARLQYNSQENMSFVYHRVPANLQGNILYPLNILKTKYSKQYQEHAKKYEGRLQIMKQTIPKLNCLWNDVLHFTAVEPRVIKQALTSSGFNPPKMRYYKIDPEIFQVEKTIVYLHRPDIEKGKEKDISNFADFKADNMEKYSFLPKETIEYYLKKNKQGEKPLLFVYVPHILFQGHIDISHCEVVEV